MNTGQHDAEQGSIAAPHLQDLCFHPEFQIFNLYAGRLHVILLVGFHLMKQV